MTQVSLLMTDQEMEKPLFAHDGDSCANRLLPQNPLCVFGNDAFIDRIETRESASASLCLIVLLLLSYSTLNLQFCGEFRLNHWPYLPPKTWCW